MPYLLLKFDEQRALVDKRTWNCVGDHGWGLPLRHDWPGNGLLALSLGVDCILRYPSPWSVAVKELVGDVSREISMNARNGFNIKLTFNLRYKNYPSNKMFTLLIFSFVLNNLLNVLSN